MRRLTPTEAGARLEASTAAVYRWIRLGLLPSEVLHGRRLLTVEAVETFDRRYPRTGARRVVAR